MPLHIPAALRESVHANAPEQAPAWLSSLPRRVLAACRRWDLRIQKVVDPGGRRSWVAYALAADGAQRVLKLSFPHPDAQREAEALRVFGVGAVEVIDDDPELSALLLAQVGDGSALSDTIWSPQHRAAHGAAQLTQLWVEPDRPWISAQERCVRWPEALARACGHSAGDRFARLLSRPDMPVALLHGDPHTGNLLRDQAMWTWIDPLPMIGPPAADVGRLVASALPPGAASHEITRTVAAAAEASGCVVGDVLLWTAGAAVFDGRPQIALELLRR